MHNYYDPLIPAEGGLAISLGDDELFGLLDEFAAPPAQAAPRPPVPPAPRAAVKGQPRVAKKSSKTALRSRPSAASLTSLNMAQSAGAAAGPHAYASVEGPPTTFSDFRLAPAAAAAALRTPIKHEEAQSPSTVLARTASTVRRNPAQALVAPSPTPATRMRSASKLVAPASDMSPAKGMFAQPAPKPASAQASTQASTQASKQVPKQTKQPPKPRGKKRPQTAPGMSGAMGSFQVTLSSAEAQPIHVPKPPDKNMPPSVMVGVSGAASSSMAARAARASAQQYHYPPQQPPPQQQAAQFSQLPMPAQDPALFQPYLPNSHANNQRAHDTRKMAPPFRYQYRPLVAPPRRPAQASSQPTHQLHPHQRTHQHTHPHQNPHPTHPHPTPTLTQPALPQSPLVPPKVSPFSEIGHSPALDYDQKSLSPVFSPPVSRSSSMRSPTEDLWSAYRSIETPPTPHASLKIPEVDEMSPWTDIVLDQWDLFSSDQLRP